MTLSEVCTSYDFSPAKLDCVSVQVDVMPLTGKSSRYRVKAGRAPSIPTRPARAKRVIPSSVVFQFCDPPILWREFFGYYAAMCGRRPRAIPSWAAGALVWANEKLNLGLPLNRERVRYLMARTIYPTAKAERLLGYQPRVDSQTGMARTETWLREAGYI